jgi:hypothetical protein
MSGCTDLILNCVETYVICVQKDSFSLVRYTEKSLFSLLKIGIYLYFNRIFVRTWCWIEPPFYWITARTFLFHRPAFDRMVSCDTRGHTFSVLCCGNSRGWNYSLWFLFPNCLNGFQTRQSNGFKCGEFDGHSVDWTNSNVASPHTFKARWYECKKFHS